MLVVGILLSISGIGFLCWLMFNLAVYALPFFAGMTAGLAAYHSGAGVLGGLLVGFLAGAITLVIGQAVFAAFASPLARGLVALVFAAPASVAGYHATLALARIGVPAEGWREAFAVVGAIAVGAPPSSELRRWRTRPASDACPLRRQINCRWPRLPGQAEKLAILVVGHWANRR